MKERWILFGLHEMEGIGKKTISKLILGQHELPDLLNYGESDWVAAGLRKDQAARLASQFTIDWIESKREHVYNQGIEVITYLDQNYPILMKETVQPPWVMYARGDISLLHNSSIAMVGTRMPTVYGRKVGEKLAEQLCNAGLTIVSGLARGIDSVCHEAVLRAKGKTIAVFGTGIDNIYPPENTSLAERIAETGLLLSEYPPGTRARQGLFPERNRIIAIRHWEHWLLRLTFAVVHSLQQMLRLKQAGMYLQSLDLLHRRKVGEHTILSVKGPNWSLVQQMYWKSIDWACQMQNNFLTIEDVRPKQASLPGVGYSLRLSSLQMNNV